MENKQKVNLNEKNEASTLIKDDLVLKLNSLKQSYALNPYPSLENRKGILFKIKDALIKYENNLYQALEKDYGYRSKFDTFVADILPSVLGINYTLKNLKKWMMKRHLKNAFCLNPFPEK